MEQPPMHRSPDANEGGDLEKKLENERHEAYYAHLRENDVVLDVGYNRYHSPEARAEKYEVPLEIRKSAEKRVMEYGPNPRYATVLDKSDSGLIKTNITIGRPFILSDSDGNVYVDHRENLNETGMDCIEKQMENFLSKESGSTNVYVALTPEESMGLEEDISYYRQSIVDFAGKKWVLMIDMGKADILNKIIKRAGLTKEDIVQKINPWKKEENHTLDTIRPMHIVDGQAGRPSYDTDYKLPEITLKESQNPDNLVLDIQVIGDVETFTKYKKTELEISYSDLVKEIQSRPDYFKQAIFSISWGATKDRTVVDKLNTMLK